MKKILFLVFVSAPIFTHNSHAMYRLEIENRVAIERDQRIVERQTDEKIVFFQFLRQVKQFLNKRDETCMRLLLSLQRLTKPVRFTFKLVPAEHANIVACTSPLKQAIATRSLANLNRQLEERKIETQEVRKRLVSTIESTTKEYANEIYKLVSQIAKARSKSEDLDEKISIFKKSLRLDLIPEDTRRFETERIESLENIVDAISRIQIPQIEEVYREE